MAVPSRVHEAHQGKPPPRRAPTETGPIHYAASLTASEAGRVRRIGAGMSRRFAKDLKGSGGGAFRPAEVMQEALALGLHFLAIQYLGDHHAFDADGRAGDLDVIDTSPVGKSKP